MRKTLFFMFLITGFIAFFNTDCKHNPVGPGDTTKVDTTSHDVQWMVDTLGSQGVIRDVWVFSKTDAWAVGEIHLNDSTGTPDINVLYNAAHWDGTKWTLKRIPGSYQGQIVYSSIYNIYAFSTSDIWFGGVHWDGSNYTTISLNGSGLGIAMKTWGTSSDNFYMVGTNGLIAHYNGSSWSLMTSNTTCDLDDIYGTDANHIWATGTTRSDGHCVVLQCNGSTWTTLYDNTKVPANDVQGFYTVWAYEATKIFLAGQSWIRSMNVSDGTFQVLDSLSHYEAMRIRGRNQNDIFQAGYGSEVMHYNGNSWYHYSELQTLNGGGAWFYGVYPMSDFVVIGGLYLTELNSFPIILRGYR